MNELKIFKSEQFGEIRTVVMSDGRVMFVGKDVATALGYTNPTKACRVHVDNDDKLMYKMDTSFGEKETLLITESGLYSLVLSSKLPQAREFKHWVTSEVLPQIRKTGGYIPVCEGDDEKTILCKALLIMQRTVELKDELIGVLKPKALYCDQVLASPSCYTMTQVAKGLSMTVFELTRKLKALGVIYQSPSGPYMLYAKHLKKGLEAYRTRTGDIHGGRPDWSYSYLVWTEKGRHFIQQTLAVTA